MVHVDFLQNHIVDDILGNSQHFFSLVIDRMLLDLLEELDDQLFDQLWSQVFVEFVAEVVAQEVQVEGGVHSENFGQVEQHVQLVRVVPDVLKQDFRQQNQLVAVAVVQVLPLLVPFQPVIDHELQSQIQFLG